MIGEADAGSSRCLLWRTTVPLRDDERWVSPSWKLDGLKKINTLHDAANYFQDYWDGWIAAPMLGSIANGGWARMTLACLSVEACAYFWRPISSWQGVAWPQAGSKRLVWRSVDELWSGTAFCWMFREVFTTEAPASIPIDTLADVAYDAFRCGLAHRGLSKNAASSRHVAGPWHGVIDGQVEIFRDLSDGTGNVLSVDPDKFAARVNHWFQVQILGALRMRSNVDVANAFKEWCERRWGIPSSTWSDF
jgi:hypothetical protein